MILKVYRLLKKYNVTTLRELSRKLKVSLNRIKNVSSGRTSFISLFNNGRRQYRIFPRHSRNLAEFIGIMLGDGNIFQFERCQRLIISCNGSYRRYIKHIIHLVRSIFKKEPSLIKRSKVNCNDVCLYLQDIDRALGLPIGNKIKNSVKIPEWIFEKKKYLIKCLKGLFETDGHYAFNKKYYIEYLQFSNRCNALNKSVFNALNLLGYSPQLGKTYVRLARKQEVVRFLKEARFIRPFPALNKNKIFGMSSNGKTREFGSRFPGSSPGIPANLTLRRTK